MMLALTTQQWTLILLAICVVPIAILIILAIILRIKNGIKKSSKEPSEEIDSEQQAVFLDAFGGKDNFIDAVLERIKVIVKVKDPELIQGEKLQELGAKGVLIVGNEVRCSFGDRAEYVYKTLAGTTPSLTKETPEDKTNE